MRHTAIIDGRRHVVWGTRGQVGHRRWHWWSPLDWARLAACKIDRWRNW